MAINRTILLIDDDATLRDLYRVKFERSGYAVLQAENGAKAIELLKGGAKPDIIILDLIMPVMDGLTFLAEASYKLRLPPVIVMTSQDEDAKKLDALIHGAHAYVIKAKVTPKDILEEIRLLLLPKG